MVFCHQEERPLGEGLGHLADRRPPIKLHDIELVLLDADLRVIGRRLIEQERDHQLVAWIGVADQTARKQKEILLLTDKAYWFRVK